MPYVFCHILFPGTELIPFLSVLCVLVLQSSKVWLLCTQPPTQAPYSTQAPPTPTRHTLLVNPTDRIISGSITLKISHFKYVAIFLSLPLTLFSLFLFITLSHSLSLSHSFSLSFFLSLFLTHNLSLHLTSKSILIYISLYTNTYNM